MSEDVVGVLKATDDRGSLDDVALILTSERIVVAQESVYDWLIVFGPVGAAMHNQKQRDRDEMLARARSGQLSAEDVLRTDRRNYAIPYSDILKVEIKPPSWARGIEISIITAVKTTNRFSRFYFGTTRGRNFRIDVWRKEEVASKLKDTIDLVRSVLPEKVLVKE